MIAIPTRSADGAVIAQPGVAARLLALGMPVPYQRPAGLLSLFGRSPRLGPHPEDFDDTRPT